MNRHLWTVQLGSIYIVDLITMRVTASIASGERISRVRLHTTGGDETGGGCRKFLLATKNANSQCLFPLEDEGHSVRETVASGSPEEFDQRLQFFSWGGDGHSPVVAYNSADSTVSMVYSVLLVIVWNSAGDPQLYPSAHLPTRFTPAHED